MREEYCFTVLAAFAPSKLPIHLSLEECARFPENEEDHTHLMFSFQGAYAARCKIMAPAENAVVLNLRNEDPDFKTDKFKELAVALGALKPKQTP